MIYTSKIEISRSALKKNLTFLRRLIGKKTKLSSVVKGNAYGHDIETFVPLAEECGIDHFSVFSAEEALDVVGVSSKKSQLMIMGHIDNDELDWAIKNNVEFWVFDFDRLEKALETAKKMNKTAKIHVEAETGLNRTGFEKQELTRVKRILKSNREYLSLEGLCTHYAGAESIANYVRIKNQIKTFNSINKKFVNQKIAPKLRHTGNSASTIVYPQTRMDMVRIGIMQYGYWPTPEVFMHYVKDKSRHSNPLKRLMTWKSKIMNVKQIKQGEFIGYGLNYLAQNDMKIAIIPVGYSQGYSRSLSHVGRVLIAGKRVDIVGMVNMNLLAVSVSKMQNVKKGDEVVLIGKQRKQEISVSSFSELTPEINYETITQLPRNIPRVIVD